MTVGYRVIRQHALYFYYFVELGFKGRKTFQGKVFPTAAYHLFDRGLCGLGLYGPDIVVQVGNQPSTVKTNPLL